MSIIDIRRVRKTDYNFKLWHLTAPSSDGWVLYIDGKPSLAATCRQELIDIARMAAEKTVVGGSK